MNKDKLRYQLHDKNDLFLNYNTNLNVTELVLYKL
jgi:hypothetical protein